MMFIQKAGGKVGDKRPIGLTNPLPRIYERARKLSMTRWRESTARSYDGLAAGKCVEDTVWKQAAQVEAVAWTGQHSSMALVDLTKAFESGILHRAWEQAIAWGYPLGILRLELELYSGERRLQLNGAISAPTFSLPAN